MWIIYKNNKHVGIFIFMRRHECKQPPLSVVQDMKRMRMTTRFPKS
jgi:hypothetical protein